MSVCKIQNYSEHLGSRLLHRMSHDLECLLAMKRKVIPRIFDCNGYVDENQIVRCTNILSHYNVTIFFYEDDSFQVMVNDQVVYFHIVCDHQMYDR